MSFGVRASELGTGQYHLAVAGGSVHPFSVCDQDGPTRYREVVLTRSKENKIPGTGYKDKTSLSS